MWRIRFYNPVQAQLELFDHGVPNQKLYHLAIVPGA